MLPKEILDALSVERPDLNWELTPLADPPDEIVTAVVDWLVSSQAGRLPSVRRYLFYLRLMYGTFYTIAACFPKQNAGREGRKDSYNIASSPEEMLYLANHLYIMNSFGVKGAVLECGCFKGYSSCCLSHACVFLSRQLIVADSFEGLPPPGLQEKEYYQAGDFAGTIDEVRHNIETFGRAESVSYLKGWFKDSLKGWAQPLALLWTDVDLYRSTLDVLENVFTTLHPQASVFSHEFLGDRVSDGRIVYSLETPGAYRDFFAANDITYAARYLSGSTAMISFPSSKAHGSPKVLQALLDHFYGYDDEIWTPRIALLEQQIGELRAHAAAVGRGRVMRLMNAVNRRLGRN